MSVRAVCETSAVSVNHQLKISLDLGTSRLYQQLSFYFSAGIKNPQYPIHKIPATNLERYIINNLLNVTEDGRGSNRLSGHLRGSGSQLKHDDASIYSLTLARLCDKGLDLLSYNIWLVGVHRLTITFLRCIFSEKGSRNNGERLQPRPG